MVARPREMLRNCTADFLGFNHYSTRLVRYSETPGPWVLSGAPEINANFEIDPKWPVGGTYWFAENPEGIRKNLVWVKENYGDIDILITENGYPTNDAEICDENRVNFFKSSLEQVLLAINEDGVNIFGYTAWSLMDNFEWSQGFTSKFGLYSVDFTDPSRPRVARDSAMYYARIISTNSLDVSAPVNLASKLF